MTSLPDENWTYLLSLLPSQWEEQAKKTLAIRRLRGTDSAGDLLRTLLLHIAHGCSLRTTAVVAKAAGWAAMSDVALLKKLRACEPWLHSLCVGLLAQAQMRLPEPHKGLRLRLVDGTLVKESGETGSQWRMLYSLSLPDWRCDFFRISPAKGKDNGESLRHYSVAPNDCLLADRGFSHLKGIEHVVSSGGHLIVRLNEQNTPLENADGSALDMLEWLRSLSEAGQVGSREAWARVDPAKSARLKVRLCAVKKSPEGAAQAQRRLNRRAQRNGQKLRPATVEHSSWVVVLTTLPASVMTDVQVLDWYRIRWQIELAFKRLKSLADAGQLPKHDAVSSRAWLYGKMLIALLTDKMQRHAAGFSPWGGRWVDEETAEESLA